MPRLSAGPFLFWRPQSTISSEIAKSIYNGDGETTQFATKFKFLRNGHVRVLLRDAGGSKIEWAEGTEYTLTGAGTDSGGTVTVSTSPTDFAPQRGENLIITRDIPNTQESALPLGGSFPSTTVQEMADLAAMRNQQIDVWLRRSNQLPGVRRARTQE